MLLCRYLPTDISVASTKVIVLWKWWQLTTGWKPYELRRDYLLKLKQLVAVFVQIWFIFAQISRDTQEYLKPWLFTMSYSLAINIVTIASRQTPNFPVRQGVTYCCVKYETGKSTTPPSWFPVGELCARQISIAHKSNVQRPQGGFHLCSDFKKENVPA